MSFGIATPVASAATYVVSPSGNDSGAGTASSPWRTLERADRATPGSTIILRGGAYGREGQRRYLRGENLIWRGESGEQALIRGKTYIDGDGARFTDVVFDGPTGDVGGNGCNGESVVVHLRASDSLIADSEIRDARGHAGLFVSDGAANVRIERNWVHDNGCFGNSSTANIDHGIYFGDGTGSITGNLIERNYARGISLHYEPRNVTVANNTIVRNGRQGILVNSQNSGIRILRNVLAYNGLARSSPVIQRVDGSAGFEVRDNVFHGNRGSLLGGAISAVGSRTVDPRFVSDPGATFSALGDRADYRLRSDSPVLGFGALLPLFP